MNKAAHQPMKVNTVDLDELALMVNGVLMQYRAHPSGEIQLLYVSDGSSAIWGLTPEEVLRDESAIWRNATPEIAKKWRSSFNSAIQNLTPWAHDLRITDASGMPKWLRCIARHRVESSGSTLWTVIVSNATNSVRVAQLEHEQNENDRLTADSLDDIGVRRFDSEMKITYWNKGSEKIYGYTSEEAVGRNVIDLLVPVDLRPGTTATMLQMPSTGQRTHSFTSWLLRKDDSLVEIKGSVMMLTHEDRDHEFVCVDCDITEQSEEREERRALESQLRESQKLESLGTLAGGVAHDFNNILAAILGNARLALMDAKGQPLVMESVQEIQRAGYRAKDLVSRILSFSRREPVSRRIMSLDSVVQESAKLLRATCSKSLDLQVYVDPGTPLVLADAGQIHQVLLNLCTNAIQAMPNQDLGRLTIRVSPHNGPPPVVRPGEIAIVTDPIGWPEVNLCLSVEDNGTGMDKSTLSRLFEPFFTTKPLGEGTGLGMPVVHGIIRDHQGALRVRSTPGEGTKFCIYLRSACGPEDAKSVFETEDSNKGVAALLPDGHIDRARVLYVDDDEMLVNLTCRILARAGFTVCCYTDSVKALAEVRSGVAVYDVAILDSSMPKLSGLELAKELRALHPDLPVAITSGHITEELRTKAPAAGVSDLVLKTSAEDHLIQTINKLISRVVL